MWSNENKVNGLLEEIERQMDATWREAHEEDGYTRERAEGELLARHPLFAAAADGTLVEIIGLAQDGEPIDDELVAVAAIVLERRLSAVA